MKPSFHNQPWPPIWLSIHLHYHASSWKMVSTDDPGIVLRLSALRPAWITTIPPMFLFSIMQLSQTVNYPVAGRPGLFAGCDNDMLCWAGNEEGQPIGNQADVRQSFKKKKKTQAIRCTTATRDDSCYWRYWLASLMGVFRAIIIKMSGRPPCDCSFYKRGLWVQDHRAEIRLKTRPVPRGSFATSRAALKTQVSCESYCLEVLNGLIHHQSCILWEFWSL